MSPKPGETYIVIRNWNRFQHYRNRIPTWVKNNLELLHDPNYLNLTLHQRGVLHGLWMEYAASRRQIRVNLSTDTRETRDSMTTLSRRLGGRVTRATLEALNHAGFIEFSDSAPDEHHASDTRAREEEETEREEEKENPVRYERSSYVEKPSYDAREPGPDDDVDFSGTKETNGHHREPWTSNLDMPRLGETLRP